MEISLFEISDVFINRFFGLPRRFTFENLRNDLVYNTKLNTVDIKTLQFRFKFTTGLKQLILGTL